MQEDKTSGIAEEKLLEVPAQLLFSNPSNTNNNNSNSNYSHLISTP